MEAADSHGLSRSAALLSLSEIPVITDSQIHDVASLSPSFWIFFFSFLNFDYKYYVLR